ncbi:MAG: c-type cytochrome [Gemmatimonadaceae bacterium]|nr:c-type cytochrome [Gemmatimonadaceae bacterium]
MRRFSSLSLTTLAAAGALTLLAACGGDDKAASGESSASGGGASATPSVSTSMDPKSITPAEIALGDSVFHGLKGAASCQACHGPKADQGTVAPNLTDAEWLHSDGSFEGIYNTIKSGVMAPKRFSGVMPPFGGAPLDAAQHRAVAAYVYSLSHKM